jgi:hypothetical protein
LGGIECEFFNDIECKLWGVGGREFVPADVLGTKPWIMKLPAICSAKRPILVESFETTSKCLEKCGFEEVM